MAYKTGQTVKIIASPEDKRFKKNEIVKIRHWFASTHLYLVENMSATAQTHLKTTDIIKCQ